MKAEELKEKFKPMVNPYMGSGMLSNTIDDDAINWQSDKCVDVAKDFANQRVIEELEDMKYKITSGEADVFDNRIKELKGA
mgnify:CR=1 FL=1